MFTIVLLIICLISEMSMVLYGYNNIDCMTVDTEEIREHNRALYRGEIK
jgi:hypothetical protein